MAGLALVLAASDNYLRQRSLKELAPLPCDWHYWDVSLLEDKTVWPSNFSCARHAGSGLLDATIQSPVLGSTF